MNKKTHWVIYGAYGYSGRLIAQEAVKRGHRPMLAGRDANKLQDLAEELGLTWRVFGLQNTESVAHALHDVALVINCAGPFAVTARTMLEACIKANAHYIDITGEIAVFEQAKSMHEEAVTAGVTLCPGAGFDVIPTDCVAKLLAEKMPDAIKLDLGFFGGRSLSPGTAKTALEGIKDGVVVREEHALRHYPLGYLQKTIDFGTGPRTATPIAWGDVSTAYTSTGIANIRVFVSASIRSLRALRIANALRPFLRLGFIQAYLKKRIGRKVTGPDEATRSQQRMHVWGEVTNSKGRKLTAHISTPNGYEITSWGPVLIAEKILSDSQQPGYVTPSILMGADWLVSLPGMGELRFSES